MHGYSWESSYSVQCTMTTVFRLLVSWDKSRNLPGWKSFSRQSCPPGGRPSMQPHVPPTMLSQAPKTKQISPGQTYGCWHLHSYPDTVWVHTKKKEHWLRSVLKTHLTAAHAALIPVVVLMLWISVTLLIITGKLSVFNTVRRCSRPDDVRVTWSK